MKEPTNQDSAERMRSVLDRLQGPLIRYAVRITRDLEQARDVVQDTFLQLFSQDLTRLNGRLDPWLFTVCRNRAIDLCRKESRMNPLEETLSDAPDHRNAGALEMLEAAEDVSDLLRALGRLPANQQEVIRLKFQNGLSYKEISQVTGLSVANVGFLIHTGIKTIREQLTPRRSPVGKNLRRVK